MAWQGVPFRVPMETGEYLSVALNSIPKILLESPTDYKGLALTAGAALAGGLIPALIAVWTFKRNYENTKKERQSQEIFLKQERKEQQLFLKEERKQQLESVQHDRELQREIAKQEFNAQVLSSNRQAWINLLRDEISSFCVVIDEYLVARRASDFNYETHEVLKKAEAEHRKLGTTPDKLTNSVEEALNEYVASYRNQQQLAYVVDRHIHKIILMMNPDEAQAQAIINVMKKARHAAIMLVRSSDKTKDNSAEKHQELNNLIDKLIGITQKYLKLEWERVKKGI